MYGNDTLELDEVVVALISHESTRRKDSDKFLDESAMVALDEAQVPGRSMERQCGSNSRVRSQSRGNHKKKCYYCDLEGHIMRTCRKLKASKEREKFDAAVAGTFAENEGDLLTVISKGTGNYDRLMDSGYSFLVFK